MALDAQSVEHLMEPNTHIPLCVGCNGTITPADLLSETLFGMLRSRPWRVLLIPFWLFQGLATLKAKLANAATPHWDSLPFNEDVISLLRDARSSGRPVHLVTASDASLALGLAGHLQAFDEVFASDGRRNLGGAAKASVLRERFGPRGYDYIGNSSADLPVWANARKAILVTHSRRLIKSAEQVTEVERVIHVPRPMRVDYDRMLRIHQWLKNLLVFVPGLAAHRIGEPKVLVSSLVAFISFSLCASAIYIVNDMLDLESDRRHPSKQKRPLAAGRIPISHGATLSVVLLLSSFCIALAVRTAFMEVLLSYFALTLAYSMLLKRKVIVDVMALAGLYTIRVIAGASATQIDPSFWLLAFSMFIFLSLALVKRYAELNLSLRLKKNRAEGRGYTVKDLPVLLSLGVASGFVGVLIVALYINNPALLMAYPSPIWLWFVPGLMLYWVSRLWMKTHRGEMHDDPVIFTMRDWQSLSVVALSGLCFVLAASAGTFGH
jgi:4-hydroxybenzoate polyprenyltransferase